MAGLGWKPLPLAFAPGIFIACHSEQSSSSIIVKASKESRSRPVACNEVGASILKLVVVIIDLQKVV